VDAVPLTPNALSVAVVLGYVIALTLLNWSVVLASRQKYGSVYSVETDLPFSSVAED